MRSRRVLTILVLFQIVLAVTFGSFAYYMDLDMFEKDDHQLKSIPIGIWWALITMTTVGYGDVVPISLGIFLSDEKILTF